jgi:hypothetical protein
MRPLAKRWCLLLLLLPARLAAASPPALESANGWLVLHRLPALLAEEEVRRQLATGLTTSLVFEVRVRDAEGRRTRGGARVDIRYELWDEVYLVTRIDASGRAARVTLPSFERLAEWWREARLTVARAPRGGQTEVRVKVIPFSQSEQLEAQRWFSQALSGEDEGSAGAVAQAIEDQPESFSQILNVLIATSIGRPALLEYEWKLRIPQGTKR